MVDILTGNYYRRPVEQASQMYEDTRQQAYEKGGQWYEGAKETAEDARRRAEESAYRAGEGAKGAAQQVYDTVRGAGEKVGQYGREYVGEPVKGTGQYAAENIRNAGEYTAEQAEKARQYMGGSKAGSAQPSGGIYEKIQQAADSVMHPFRKNTEEGYMTGPSGELI